MLEHRASSGVRKHTKKQRLDKVRKESNKERTMEEGMEGGETTADAENDATNNNRSSKGSSSPSPSLSSLNYAQNKKNDTQDIQVTEEGANHSTCKPSHRLEKEDQTLGEDTFGETMASAVQNEIMDNKLNYDQIVRGYNEAVRDKSDAIFWLRNSMNNATEDSTNGGSQNREAGRAHSSIEELIEPNSAESKFFRFSALAKELSGR